MLLQRNCNSLVFKHKQKQRKISKNCVSKLNCKIELFEPFNGHQNCLDKSLLGFLVTSHNFLNIALDRKQNGYTKSIWEKQIFLRELEAKHYSWQVQH